MNLETVGPEPTYVRLELLNTSHEANVLMLSRIIDTLGSDRVKLITDYLNTTSRLAVLKFGARDEGSMSNHVVMADGRV